MEQRDFYQSVVSSLSNEIDRIFGEDGVRNLILKDIEKWKKLAVNEDDELIQKFFVKKHDDLVEYIEVLNGRLPF